MRPDVQFIALFAVSNVFQVIMGDGVFIRIGHEIGESLRFPVE